MKIKKYLFWAILIGSLFLVFTSNVAHAETEISSAILKNGGDCGYHLQFWDKKQNAYSYVRARYVYYEENNTQYPAYCLDKNLPGVGSDGFDSCLINITHVLEDARIWRAIINGYPYKTPQDMGVEDKYDAFMATKQAIYSILYDTDVESYYRGNDSRGIAIKNAIRNMVEIGRNGTQTPENTDIRIIKNGEIYEDGEYYSQNYNVESPVQISLYTIIATNNLPNGSKITDVSNNEKNMFNGNETFKIMIPKQEFNKDINVNIVVKSKCRNYPVFYGETTIPGTQDYAVCYDPYGDIVGRVNLEIKTNNGKIQINKIDSETRNPIQGVTFVLFDKNDSEIARATTDQNGIAIFDELYQDTYKIKEISTDKEYILSEESFNIKVDYNKISKLNIENEKKKGNLKIIKVDKDDNKIRLGGIEFELYSEELNKSIGKYVTNQDGEIFIKNLRIGKYKIHEIKTNKWYELAEDMEINIKWNDTTKIEIPNEKKKGKISVIKTDGENDFALEGVVFIVKNSKGNIVDRIVTGIDGKATTKELPINEEYYVYEESTKKGYILSKEEQVIQLKADEIKTIQFKNYKEYGEIKIKKISSDGKNISGIEFKISGISDTGEYYEAIYKTNENGEIYIEKILAGEYKIEELISEINNNYIIPEAQKVKVKNNEKAEIEFFNQLVETPETRR